MMEAEVGIEPTNDGFANHKINLFTGIEGYATHLLPKTRLDARERT